MKKKIELITVKIVSTGWGIETKSSETFKPMKIFKVTMHLNKGFINVYQNHTKKITSASCSTSISILQWYKDDLTNNYIK